MLMFHLNSLAPAKTILVQRYCISCNLTHLLGLSLLKDNRFKTKQIFGFLEDWIANFVAALPLMWYQKDYSCFDSMGLPFR